MSPTAKTRKTDGRARGGNNVSTHISDNGISTPPENPCNARNVTISGKFDTKPQAAEKNRNKIVLPIKYRRNENTPDSQPESGMTIISPIKYAVEIHPPLSRPMPMPP